jgi:AcrR family transcriptional regulator
MSAEPDRVPSVDPPVAVEPVALRPAGRGRPRDPQMESRVLSAALDVYAAAGWSGFTFEAIARAARVGKPAIYRRWASREDLLFDVVDLQMPAHELPDTGSIRGDLMGMAEELLNGHVRGPGAAVGRLELEAAANPDTLGRIHEKLVLSRRTPSREMVLRGIRRGELRADTPITTLLDLVAGAMANHWRSALRDERAVLVAHRDEYVASVVDAALASFLV